MRLAVTAGLIASIGVVTGTGGATPIVQAIPPGAGSFVTESFGSFPTGWVITDTNDSIRVENDEAEFGPDSGGNALDDTDALTSVAYDLSGRPKVNITFDIEDESVEGENFVVSVVNGAINGGNSQALRILDMDTNGDGSYAVAIPTTYLIAGTQVQFTGTGDWDNNDYMEIDDFALSVPANPDLPLSCGIDVVVVLDESGSVDDYEADVRAAVVALVGGLQDTGSQLRFTEFSTTGRNAKIGGSTAFQPVTATLTTQVETYLDGSGSSDETYNPGGTTNWEAGLAHAAANPGPGDLVVFITDGEPNEPVSDSDDAAARAEDELDSIRAAGAHVLGIGVGSGAGTGSNFERLRDTIEPAGATVWSGTGPLDISTVDVLRVPLFSELQAAMQEVVFSLCSPSVSITKTDDAGAPIEGHQFVGQIDVAATGPYTDQYQLVQPSAFAGITADDGTGNDLPRPALTSPSGVATFRWIPNSLADPQPWDSSFTFTETLAPGWTIQNNQNQCQIKRLSGGVVSQIQADLGVSQVGSLVTFNLFNPGTTTPFVISKGDIVTCGVVNQRPATITIVKDAQPNSGTAFGFTSTGGNDLPASFALTNEADGSSTSSKTVNVPAGDYSVTENLVPGWNQSLSCSTTGDATATTDQGARKATIAATPGSTTTCTYVNVATANLVLEKTWLVGQANDTATLTADVDQDGVDRTFVSTASGTNPQTDTDTTIIPIVLGDVIDLAETVNPAVDYTSSLTCVDAVSGAAISGLTTAPDGRSGTLTTAANSAAAGATITCTFENPYRRAAVKVIKATVPTTDNGSFKLDISTSQDGSVATTTGGNLAETSVLLDIGDSVTVSEAAGGGTDLTNYTSSVSCVGPNGFSDSDGSFDIPLNAAGGTITCTITNTRKTANIVLAKTWANAVIDDAVTISATRANAPSDAATLSHSSAADTASETDTGLPSVVYAGEILELSEVFTTGAANLYDSTLECTGAADTNAADGVTVSTTDTSIVCTYTNTRKSATFTLDKSWGAATAGEIVNLDADGTDPANGQIIVTTATAPDAAAATNSMTVFAGESVSFDETFDTPANAANYNTSVSCTDGSGAEFDDGNRGGSYEVGTDPVNVTCTFTNSLKTSGVIVQKVWVNGATGDTADLKASINGGDPETDQSFAPDAPVINSTDEAADNVVTIPAFVGQTVDFSETLNAPTNYTTAWACTDAASTTGSDTSGSVTVGAADENNEIICTITNTRKSANIVLTKDWATSPTNGDAVDLTITGGTATPVAGTNTNDDGTAVDVDATSVVYAGETLTLNESFPNAANYDTDLTCVGGGTLTYTSGTSGTIAVNATDADATITCTFTNTRKSTTLTLAKDWVSPATGDETTLKIDATIDDSDLATAPVATAGQTVTSADASSVIVYAGESVTLSEALDPNADNTGTYTVSGFTCTAGTSNWTTGADDLSVALAAADVATAINCTVTNTRNSAQVTLAKTWDDPVGGTELELAGNGTAFAGDDTITANLTSPTGGSDSMTIYSGEAVALSEAFDSEVDRGYFTTTMTCGTDLVTTSLSATGHSYAFTASDNPADMTCTFHNGRNSAPITVAKSWVDGAADDSVTLTIDGNAIGDTTDVTSLPAVVPAGGNGPSAETAASTAYAGETITLSETFGTNTSSYDVTAFTCTSGTVTGWTGATDLNGAVAITEAMVGDGTAPIACSITNTRRSAELTLVKDWVDPAGGPATVTLAATAADSGTAISASPIDSSSPADTVTINILGGETVTLAETFGTAIGQLGSDYYDTTFACGTDTPTAVGLSTTIEIPASPTDITCEFTNTRKSLTVNLAKAWVGAVAHDEATLSIDATNDATNSATPSVAPDGDGTSASDIAVTAYYGETIGLAETLDDADNTALYTTTNLTCDQATPTWVAGALTGSVVVPAVDDAPTEITCTFENTAQRGTIVVVKSVEGADGMFDFDGSWPVTGATIDPAAVTDPSDFSITTSGHTGTVTFTDVLVPKTGTYSIGEADPRPNYDGTNVTCADADQGSGPSASSTQPLVGTVELDNDETVTCTFTNTQRSTIVVIKDAQPNSDADFSFTTTEPAATTLLDDAFTLDDDADNTLSNTFTSVLVPADAQYTVTEASTAGWSLDASSNCSTGGAFAGSTATITPAAGATVTCTFVNTADPVGLTATKTVTGVTGPWGDFTFTLSGGDFSGAAEQVVNSASTGALWENLDEGSTYTVTESAAAGYQPGATFACTITLPGQGQQQTDLVDGGAAAGFQFTATAGATYSCDITNVAIPPTLTVKKTTVDAVGTFLFDVEPTDGGAAVADITVTTTNVTNPATSAAVDLEAGIGYTVSEQPNGTWVAGPLSCTVTPAGGTAVDYVAGTATKPGDAIACAVTNTAPADVSITKVATTDDAVLQSDGSYTVTYTVRATNSGIGSETFDVTDTPAFGAGTTITEVSVDGNPVTDGGDGAADGTYLVADDLTLAGSVSAPYAFHEYTVVVSFTVETTVAAEQRDCVLDQGETGTGSLNSAQVVIDSQSSTPVGDCAEIPDPNISSTKSVLADQPVLVSGDTYTVSYDVTVTNDGEGPGTYTATDTPMFGAGTTITEVTVDGGAPLTPVAGVYTLATDVSIEANTAVAPDPSNATHTYRVVVTFTVAGSTTPGARDCDVVDPETGSGLLNTVVVTPNIGDPDPAEACTEIPDPDISSTKSVLADQPVLVSGDTYTVSYDVTVTNDGEGPGTYTAIDTPMFGAGTTITEVTVDGGAPLTPVAGVYTLATDVSIDGTTAVPSDSVDTYRVVVTFTVAGSTIPGARDCDVVDPETGSGLLNTVVVTPSIGDPDPAEACTEIPDPNISTTKTAVSDSATFLGDELYEVAYDVAVINSGDGPGSYVLTDTPSFGAGVTIVSATVDTVAVNPLAATFPVASGSINAGSTLTYRVVVRFTVDGSIATSESTCSGASGSAGEGTFNTVTVDPNIGPNDTDTDCSDIPTLDLQIVKTDGGATAVAGGAPFSYTIAVTNIGDRDADANDPITVTDTLPAGLVWVTVPADCTQSGQSVTCDLDPADLTVGADAVVYTLTARALATAASGTYTNIAVVDTEDDPPCVGTGCTPPPCPASTNNNVDCEDTPVAREGSIKIVKTDDVAAGDFVEAGDQFTYRIVVTNDGVSSVLPGLEVTDDLPSELTLVSAVAGTGWTCNAADPLVCTYAPTLAPGTSAPAIVVTVRVNADADADVIDNVAKVIGAIDRDCTDESGPVDFDNFEAACDEVTDEDTETTPMESDADLSIVKSSSVETIGAGASFDWILDIRNDGPATAVNVVVTDTMPSRAKIVSVTSDEFECDFDGQDVTCTAATLASGATGQVVIRVSVAATDPGGEMSNIGNVASDTPDPSIINNTDQDPIDVVAQQPPTPTTVAPPPPATLPKTGNSGTGDVLRSALLLIAAGGFILLLARRRRHA